MQTINFTNILGHIGSEPQLTVLPNGTNKTTISIATNSGSADRQKTQWHTALFWGEAALTAANFKKGDGLFVNGYTDYRKWTDTNTGVQREKTEIHVQEFSKNENPMKTINQISILGHLGSDAQFKKFNDNAKTTISIATNTGSIDRQKTQWHTIVLWGKAAEVTAKLKKGDTIFIIGSTETRKWNDTNSGLQREKTEIHAHQFSIIRGEVGQISNSYAKPATQNHNTQNQEPPNQDSPPLESYTQNDHPPIEDVSIDIPWSNN